MKPAGPAGMFTRPVSSVEAGASGAIEWTLSGALLPSASGQVSFAVDVVAGP